MENQVINTTPFPSACVHLHIENLLKFDSYRTIRLPCLVAFAFAVLVPVVCLGYTASELEVLSLHWHQAGCGFSEV